MNTPLSLIVPAYFTATAGNDFTGPSLAGEFDPAPILFVGTPFALNRIILVRLIAVLCLFLIMFLYSRRARLVPGKAQSAVESLLEFSRVQIGEQILGPKAGPYQPFLATLFLGILFMNLTGVIPGLQIAGTSLFGMPLIFGIYAYIGFIVAGVRNSGIKFFRNSLMPPGVPAPLYILMIPIELFSTFILRPITLALRLLVNMVSGHFILVLCFLGTNYLYFTISGAIGVGAGTLTLLAGIVFVVFEIFVAALQAFIFTMLSGVYVLMSISE